MTRSALWDLSKKSSYTFRDFYDGVRRKWDEKIFYMEWILLHCRCKGPSPNVRLYSVKNNRSKIQPNSIVVNIYTEYLRRSNIKKSVIFYTKFDHFSSEIRLNYKEFGYVNFKFGPDSTRSTSVINWCIFFISEHVL